MAGSSEKPDGSHDLVPSPNAVEYEVPVVTAALSRRALRQRQEAASVEPVIETRRERRERELASASALASVASESASALASVASESGSTPVAVTEVAPSAAGRRARRDTSGLEHLLAPRRTPAAAPTTRPATATSAASTASAAPTTSAAPVTAVSPAASVRSITFSHADDTVPRAAVSAPRAARDSMSAPTPRRQVLSTRLRGASRSSSRKRTIVNSVVMVATAGLVATLALPAYAYSDLDGTGTPNTKASSQLGIQSLTVDGVNSQPSVRDSYTSTGDVAAMDSTTGTTVSPTVQALAAELVADVAAGKLVGSVPDHIVEIRNLANGIAVPGCGVDYRVLQTIKVAVDNFDKVGVSDINRKCTGQIEGAGTASAHYKDGGGHAVDFYILNGHGLTGADSDSLKLIRLLDPIVPPGSGLGQASCGRSISLTNFAPFDDTCTHLHVDFGAAKGVSLTD